MARNGSGTFSSTVDFTTEAASPPIEIAKLDTAITDIGGEITNSIAADGQTNPTADLPMNGFNHTGVDNAAARDQYASAADVQDQDLTYFVDSGAADAYVITPSPSIGAYEEGQRLVFRATNTNTGASTLNVNALGTRAIQTPDGQALDAGAIVDGGLYEVTYDANTTPDRWVLTSPPSAIPDSMLSSNVPLLNQSNTFTGSEQRVSGSAPIYSIYESDAGTDEKLWYIGATSVDKLIIQTRTDVGAGGASAVEITRTGTTIDEIELNATLLDFNGNMDVSGTLDVGGAIALDSNITQTNSSATSNIYTGNGFSLMVLNDSASAANEGRWRFISDDGLLQIATETDAGAGGSAAISVFRTGTTIDEIQLDAATLLDFNSNVDISGSLVLGTALAVAEGGTGSTTASGARTNLGLAIGTDVQAQDADLTAIAALANTDGNFIVGNGSAWVAESGATARTSLGAADSDLSEVDFSGLTAIQADGLASVDGFLVDDAGTTKRMEYTDSGVRVQTVAGTTDTLATADMNTFIHYTSASAVAVTLNTGVGKVGNFITIKQGGAGQVTVSGTATLESAVGTATRAENSVITLLCQAANTWAVFGDGT